MECRIPSRLFCRSLHRDVTVVYQLLGVGFLLHQLVCLPRDEMKISPRSKPNIIASCLVSFHGTPVAAFASSNNRLRIHNKGGRTLWSGRLQLCHLAKMASEPCPRDLSLWSLVALPPGVHLWVSRQDEPWFPSPWLTRSLDPCWVKVTSFTEIARGHLRRG